MTDGWNESAAAWIADMGDEGDFGRREVLDAPMLQRVRSLAPKCALDIGCGEGRFCRHLRAMGVDTIGVDPTAALIDEARRRDPGGDYRAGRAEALNFEDDRFDLAVSCLTLIDIPDYRRAIAEMARVVRPGGAILVANLTSFSTASALDGWTTTPTGERQYPIDHYMEERAHWIDYRGIRVRNWHRPLSAYMASFLSNGLLLTHFDEPLPRDMSSPKARKYSRVPWFVVIEWRKPG